MVQRAMSRLSRLLVPLVLLGAAAPPAPAPPPAPAEIRILSDVNLPPAFEWATDVRWASDSSVFLGLAQDGTVEVSLDPVGSSPREIIPGTAKPGGFWASVHLAVSSQYVVAAAQALTLTWRRLGDSSREEMPFEGIEGIDVRENQLAIVGVRRDEKGNFGTDGAIAWLGSLDKKLADLKPVLYDAGGPGAPMMDRCGPAQLGAVRFLPDGSLLVVPGVQPGVNLYDTTGKLAHSWDTAALGVDTDCASLSYEAAKHLQAHGLERQAWVNQRRTVDAILPLAQGPGLVVRRFDQGCTHWDLKLLRRDGSAKTYTLPIEGNSGAFNLQGDVRSGKMVFLLHETLYRGGGKTHPTPPRLIVAYPPEG